MIIYLKPDEVRSVKTDLVVIVNGVGYLVLVGGQILPEEVSDGIFVWFVQTQDSTRIYGFRSLDDRLLAEMLATTPGIGPKIASSIVQQLGFSELVGAVLAEQPKRIATVRGVSVKTAGKLIGAMSEWAKSVKPTTSSEADGTPTTELYAALEALGITPDDHGLVARCAAARSLQDAVTAYLKERGLVCR